MTGALITPAELAARLGEPGLVIIDATVELAPPAGDGDWRASAGGDRFAAGHIPGAVHADLLGDLSDRDAGYHFAHLPAATLAARLAELGVGCGTTAIVYDDDQRMWSTRLWLELRAIGFDTAAVLDGGLGAWRAAGLPLEQGRSAPIAVSPVEPRPRAGVLVGRDDVLAVVEGQRDAQLLCTLRPEAFRGDVATRYARRGRIARSVNAPADAVLQPDGRFLPPVLLRDALQPVLDDPRPIVLYCGGGISASLMAFALGLAGRDDVAVYDGSLEEWSADPLLPMEVG